MKHRPAAPHSARFGALPQRTFTAGGPRWLACLFALLMLALVAACAEEEPLVDAEAGELAQITLSPSLGELPLYGRLRMTATGTLRDGTEVDLTNSALWSVTGDPVGNLVEDGTILGYAAGTLSVTATDEASGLQDTAIVAVRPAMITRIDLFSGDGRLYLGLPLQLLALATLSDDSTLDVTNSVQWSVSDGSIALTTQSGLLTGLGLGTTTVIATDPETGVQASVSIEVLPAVLQSIELIVQRLLLPLGLSQAAQVIGHLSNGATVDLTTLVDWESTNPSVLGVSSNGVLTALGLGSSTLTATEPGSGLAASLPVQVTPAVLEVLQVVPDPLDLLLGLIQPLQAIGHYSDGTQVDLTENVDWKSDDPFIAAVSDTGNVLGIGLGSTLVRATHAASQMQATGTVNVLHATLERVDLLAESLNLPLGLSQTLTAVGHYNDGSTRDLTGTVTWRVNNGELASILPGGVLTGLGLGGVVVTATDAASGVTATLPVQVTGAALESVQVLPGTTNVLLGLLQPLQAIGTYSDGSQVDITDAVQWSSDNPLVAAVNSAGGVMGLLLGETAVRAKDAATGLEGAAAVTVKSLLGG